MRTQKIAKVLEQRYKGKYIDLNELCSFIKNEIKPIKFEIKNVSSKENAYLIKVSMIIKKDIVSEFYIKPF